jgi:hypothetical protein
MIPMALKVLIILCALVCPAGNLARREVLSVDPPDSSSLHVCAATRASDHLDGFFAWFEAPGSSAGWFTNTEDDLIDEDGASASLCPASDQVIRRVWSRFVPVRESPIVSRLINRRVPLLC